MKTLFFQGRSLAILSLLVILVSSLLYFDDGIKRVLLTADTAPVKEAGTAEFVKTVYRPVPTNDLQCMAENIYYEAGIESHKGKVAVGQVVLHRVKAAKYPSTICGVIYQPSLDAVNKPKGCQFSWTCQADLPEINKNSIAWQDSLGVAIELLTSNQYQDLTGGATHYHAHYVNPAWNKRLLKTVQIDRHIFYKYPVKS